MKCNQSAIVRVVELKVTLLKIISYQIRSRTGWTGENRTGESVTLLGAY